MTPREKLAVRALSDAGLPRGDDRNWIQRLQRRLSCTDATLNDEEAYRLWRLVEQCAPMLPQHARALHPMYDSTTRR